ncbi:hypothetical protein PG993_003604 [Apiospora rasikravindrae]|uniref:Uncharacterized protein n=1 Tax=Apiospora rasikravindrae TaxID=990691 RepID=A0ABR1U2S3_9PEZI
MTKMLWGTALATSIFAVGAHAGVDAMGGMAPVEPRMANAGVPMPVLEERQDSNLNLDPSNSTNNNANTGMNMQQWNTDTLKACQDALAQLTTATNPSGTAVCYNLPSLDTKTGAFMADLRLFQVSQPNGDFTGIPAERIQVGLQYRGASVSPLQSNQARSLDDTPELVGRANSMTPLQSYMFVGQIDQAQMAQPMTMGVLEALVLPQVTLSATNAGGASVSTNVSSNEAAFVNGIFSKEVIMSDIARAQLAVNDMVAGLQNGTVAFILPGVELLIFPIGLIITSVWMVVGFAAYGLGTFERINHRHTFRTRKLRAGKGAQSTF